MALNLKPFSPMQGPPLPQFVGKYLPFNGYWPWYKAGPGPTPTTGVVIIVVTPSNAIITLNNKTVSSGASTSLAPGTYNYSISASGYTTATGTLTVVAGQTTTKTVALTAIPSVDYSNLDTLVADNSTPLSILGAKVIQDGNESSPSLWTYIIANNSTADSLGVMFQLENGSWSGIAGGTFHSHRQGWFKTGWLSSTTLTWLRNQNNNINIKAFLTTMELAGDQFGIAVASNALVVASKTIEVEILV